MFQEISSELKQLRENVDRLHKIQSMQKDLTEQLNHQRTQEAQLHSNLEKENRDYDRITKPGLSALFYSVLGSREQQIEKERQEALAAKLKFNQCQFAIKNLESRIELLRKESAALCNSERDYFELLRQKEKAVVSKHGENADEILHLQQELFSCTAAKKEINEALAVGDKVLAKTNQMLGSLTDAKGWGTWDLLGGGLLTDMAKHSHIDDARDIAREISSLLNQFHSELADVRIDANLQINIDDFLKFSDYFFDGLIADWMVQDQILHSIDNVERLKAQISSVLKKLSEIRRQNEEYAAKSEQKLEEFILNV